MRWCMSVIQPSSHEVREPPGGSTQEGERRESLKVREHCVMHACVHTQELAHTHTINEDKL